MSGAKGCGRLGLPQTAPNARPKRLFRALSPRDRGGLRWREQGQSQALPVTFRQARPKHPKGVHELSKEKSRFVRLIVLEKG
jgi:hypothetical protein